jgi:lipoprotein NlpD
MQLAWKAWMLVAATVLVAGCGTQKPSPVVDRSSPSGARPAATATTPAVPVRTQRDGVYTVQRGDTLAAIAQSFRIDVRELARWNGLADGAALAPGQTLRVMPPPSAASAATVSPVAPIGSAEVRPLPLPGAEGAAPGGAAPAPAVPPAALPPAVVPPAAAAPARPEPESARPAVDGAVQWQWPAPGKVIETFDETRNKGVDIAGNDGDPVSAAADGEVVYVGSALRGYGNLVIVKHSEEFISAYAHNRQVIVKQGQAVKRGQRIAEFGRSDAERTKLHFEIRRQGKPVDPLRYLPPR